MTLICILSPSKNNKNYVATSNLKEEETECIENFSPSNDRIIKMTSEDSISLTPALKELKSLLIPDSPPEQSLKKPRDKVQESQKQQKATNPQNKKVKISDTTNEPFMKKRKIDPHKPLQTTQDIFQISQIKTKSDSSKLPATQSAEEVVLFLGFYLVYV